MLCVSKHLAVILGFETSLVDTTALAAISTNLSSTMYRLWLVGALKARLSKTESIYVYTDIAKPQAVGDTEAPLLGIIPVTGNFGERCYWSFNPPIYMGVNKAYIDEVKVMLRSETGEAIPFPKDSPSVICSLRFRCRKSAI